MSTEHQCQERTDWVQELIVVLSHPEEWTLDNYTLNHISGLKLWVGNGYDYLGFYKPAHTRFTWWKRRRLWPHVKRCMEQVKRSEPTEAELIERAVHEAYLRARGGQYA